MMLRIVVFASGRGSNARSLFALAKKNPDKISVVALVSNRKKAGVIEYAKEFGVPSFVVPVRLSAPKKERRQQHEKEIAAVLDGLSFDYICLAGYMRIFTPQFVARYPHSTWPVSKIINIHPSLLPSFPGTSGYGDALRYGVKYSGVTLHFVDAGVDTGPIIHQRIVERKSQDTFAQFQTRGLHEEHQAYKEMLLALSDERYVVHHSPFSLFLQV